MLYNKLNLIALLFIPLLIIFSFFGCAEKEHDYAELVLINGSIVTVDNENPTAEALAVKNDTLMSIAGNDEIEQFIGDKTEVIDLKGKFVIPGFIESHAHFIGIGNSKMNLDLREAENWDEIIALVAEAVDKATPGEWIIGRGWHQEKWDPVPISNIEGYPLHYTLSSASPYNPVLLKHASGHAIFTNKKAMQIAGIDTSTTPPEGGRIVRDTLGNAIGVFEEEAEYLITKYYNQYLSKKSNEELIADKIKAIKLAEQECLSKGITTFHDAGVSFETIDLYKEQIDLNNIGLRLYVMLIENNKKLQEKISDYKLIGYGNNHLTVRAIKRLIDGALGSRGAWMLDEYSDLPEHTGLNTTSLTSLRKTASIALEHEFQLCTHAIGDRGNREILNIYKSAFKKNSISDNNRWRIEHAQHLSQKDIPRFKELGIIAAMQGIHCTSDAVFVLKRLGAERAEAGAYVWRKLLNSGAIICNGTDAPVENVDPIKNYYATVTRRLTDGTTFYPDQKLTRMEALETYTINGAYAAFEENIKGSLKKGKLADITILSQDILTVPDEEILNTKVLMTIVGGKILYSDL